MGFVTPLLLSALADFISEKFYQEDFFKESQSLQPLILALSGVVVFLLGRWLNSSSPKRLLDLESKKIIYQKSLHTIYWIRLEYWGFIIFLVAFWIFFANIGLVYRDSFQICR